MSSSCAELVSLSVALIIYWPLDFLKEALPQNLVLNLNKYGINKLHKLIWEVTM